MNKLKILFFISFFLKINNSFLADGCQNNFFSSSSSDKEEDAKRNSKKKLLLELRNSNKLHSSSDLRDSKENFIQTPNNNDNLNASKEIDFAIKINKLNQENKDLVNENQGLKNENKNLLVYLENLNIAMQESIKKRDEDIGQNNQKFDYLQQKIQILEQIINNNRNNNSLRKLSFEEDTDNNRTCKI